MGTYRYTIGLGDKYSFGTELEFTGVVLDYLAEMYSYTSLPVRHLPHHKWYAIDYKEWYLDEDSTVTEKSGSTCYGGELSSRILIDKKKIWLELKAICDVLKRTGARVNGRCSNHIWVNLFNVVDERYFFEVLVKLIILYEIDIDLFYMGEHYLYRDTRKNNAMLLSPYLLEYINKIDFKNLDYYYPFTHYNENNYFCRRYVINLQEYPEKRLMEIRYPNGTINEKIIQNNINFSLKLVDAINRRRFDLKELTRKIETTHSGDLHNKIVNYESNYKNFEYLVRNISSSVDDINDFMSQYEGVLSSKILRR